MPRSSSSVSPTSITSIADSLTTLPEKPKESYTLREAVAMLAQPIRAALNKGYSHTEIAEMLMGQGILISPASLKAYLPQEKTQVQRKRRSRKDAQSTVAATPDSAPVEEPIGATPAEEAAPKRRGRKPGTKTAAKSKAAPRTTAAKGRGRKKA